jgi:hypothetical protein
LDFAQVVMEGNDDMENYDVVQCTEGFLGLAIPTLPSRPRACHVTESWYKLDFALSVDKEGGYADGNGDAEIDEVVQCTLQFLGYACHAAES